MAVKIYLDISDIYHKDIPDKETSNRLSGLVRYILEDRLPLDLIETFCQCLNWSPETVRYLEEATNEAYCMMQNDIEFNKHQKIEDMS